jgi:hypothetical protein
MIGYTEAPQAWARAAAMARAAGVDLQGAVFDGWLRRSELAELVQGCVACGRSVQCGWWLAQPRGDAGLPGFCGNKAGIEALAV